MRVILSTEKLENIQEKLMQCRNIPEVHDAVMELPYFCFLNIGPKQNIDAVKKELTIFFSAFRTSLNVYVMHNEYFYELDGVNRLNFFDYFRNIVERNTAIKLPITEKVTNFVENILDEIKSNNYNENELLSLEKRKPSYI